MPSDIKYEVSCVEPWKLTRTPSKDSFPDVAQAFSASCPLPTQLVVCCQVRMPKQTEVINLMKNLGSFPTIPPLKHYFYIVILLVILDLTLCFRNKVSPKWTCLISFPSIRKLACFSFLLNMEVIVNVLFIIWGPVFWRIWILAIFFEIYQVSKIWFYRLAQVWNLKKNVPFVSMLGHFKLSFIAALLPN